MHALGTGQCLRRTVLGEQRYGRDLLARQHAIEVLHQGKAGALDDAGGLVGTQFRPLHELLHGRFHGPQHQSGRAHADHFQRTAGLVQLLARDAQGTGVQRSQVGLARDVGVADKAAHGLDGPIQRLAQLVEHPRERPQVLFALGPISAWCVCSVKR